MNLRKILVLLVLIGLMHGGPVALAHAIDLGQRYPATLEYSEQSEGYSWTCTAQDIWRLKEFRYALGDEFSIRLGPAQVIFGCHGTNVVWAVVIPDQPGEIVAAKAGQGEHITSIWLRFHPARVGELFPAAGVLGPGDAAARPLALRVAAHKMHGCWQANNQPTIPQRKTINLDIDTREGQRRFYYSADTESGKVNYVDAFRTRPVPAVKPLDSQAALTAFDKVWQAFDREYAMFAIKPQVDWAQLRTVYRPRAAAAKTNQELATIIGEMLDHLEDLHVYVQVDGTYVPGYRRDRPLNANPAAWASLIGSIASTHDDLDWGRTRDGIGYLNIDKLTDDTLPQAFDEVLGQMADTKGLILDLRFNGGGNELLGCQITGRLLDRSRVYSQSQFRNGPKHSDLGPKNTRVCRPDGPWHYVGPVVVLQGQRTMSSAESFALALAQCPQVTTLGDRTAGSSGNPRRLDAGAGIVVNLPRWIDMDPQGKPIDVVGVAPRVKIDAQPKDFSGTHDPVLTAALERLRTRPKAAAPPGGVLQHRPGVPAPKERPKVVSVFPAPDATEVDPLTEIRIRFDRPMDPNKMGLHAGQGNAPDPFHLNGSPQYHPQGNEFAVPLILEPGRQYAFSIERSGAIVVDFRSIDGARAAPYSWRFTTRKRIADRNASKPRVVGVDPPSGAETGMVVAIRVRFDRPMNPQAFELVDSIGMLRGVSVPFPVEYDAASHCFTFPALLPGKTKHRVELRGFRGADGGQAEPISVEYRVGGKLYRPEQEARIAEAGRSAKLREVIDAIRGKRLAMKSLEELVRVTRLREDTNHRPGWFSDVETNYGRFGFQADRQFYADVTSIMDILCLTTRTPPFPFRIGSDGRECWFQYRNLQANKMESTVYPFDAMRDRSVTICDPFGPKQFFSTEKAIELLKLEYLGTVTREGRSCHRIRSWAGQVFEGAPLGIQVYGIRDWLIDAQTLLPAVCTTYGLWTAYSHEFIYQHINQHLAEEAFQSPTAADIARKPAKLEAGYDRFFLKACDGSNGRMSARWGQKGPKGTCDAGLK
jgi:hypothetical protein